MKTHKEGEVEHHGSPSALQRDTVVKIIHFEAALRSKLDMKFGGPHGLSGRFET